MRSQWNALATMSRSRTLLIAFILSLYQRLAYRLTPAVDLYAQIIVGAAVREIEIELAGVIADKIGPLLIDGVIGVGGRWGP